MSVISSHDLVCATLATDSLVLWSFVTQQVYKVIPTVAYALSYGSGMFSIGREDVMDITISGDIVHTVKSESIVTCSACLELGKDATRRVLIIGTQNGFVDFYSCGEKLVQHRCGKVAIAAIDVYDQKITIVDVRGCSYIIQMEESYGRCIQCGVLTDRKCIQCQKPLCANCAGQIGLCKDCNDRVNSPMSSGIMQ